MGQPLPHYDEFGRRVPPELPWLPAAGPEGETGYSVHIQRALKTMELPPLFAEQSWTKNVMQKDVFEYYKPSETIGMDASIPSLVDLTQFIRVRVHTLRPKVTYTRLAQEAQEEICKSSG